jgi:hypothetical protein
MKISILASFFPNIKKFISLTPSEKKGFNTWFFFIDNVNGELSFSS